MDAELWVKCGKSKVDSKPTDLSQTVEQIYLLRYLHEITFNINWLSLNMNMVTTAALRSQLSQYCDGTL